MKPATTKTPLLVAHCFGLAAISFGFAIGIKQEEKRVVIKRLKNISIKVFQG